jgi:hypothetical protein
MDVDPLAEVFVRCIPLSSEEDMEFIVFRRGWLPLRFTELLLDTALTRLPSLDIVVDRGMPVPVVSLELRLGVGAHSANASWGFRIDSTALCFPVSFFSFFSMSFTTALRLRAPLADIIGH